VGARKFVALFLLVLIALLYAGPLRSYYNKRELVSRQRAQVESLRSQQNELARKLRWASTREAAEREARRLFYVKPGEHLYIVKGVVRWQQARARQHQ
jgi:cell division protein FtsB